MSSRLLIGPGGGTAPPLFDDEFDQGNRGWTLSDLLSNGYDFGVTNAGHLRLGSGSVAHRARIPAMPFTVTAFLSSVVFDDINTTYGNATLGIAEASPAGSPGPKWWGPEMPDVDSLGATARYDGRFANFAATPTHLGTRIDGSGHAFEVPTYQRIIVHSATNMDIEYSTDGVSYSSYGTGFNPTLTPGAIILVSFACTTQWDWVRFT
jgi:hypothetical protein